MTESGNQGTNTTSAFAGLSIARLQKLCYEQAVASGWAGPDARDFPMPEALCLLHTEVSEAMEAYRNSEPMSWTDEQGKPQGVASEFADIVIRLGHYSEKFGINLEEEVLKKLRYNATRPYRHGGKQA